MPVAKRDCMKTSFKRHSVFSFSETKMYFFFMEITAIRELLRRYPKNDRKSTLNSMR